MKKILLLALLLGLVANNCFAGSIYENETYEDDAADYYQNTQYDNYTSYNTQYKPAESYSNKYATQISPYQVQQINSVSTNGRYNTDPSTAQLETDEYYQYKTRANTYRPSFIGSVDTNDSYSDYDDNDSYSNSYSTQYVERQPASYSYTPASYNVNGRSTPKMNSGSTTTTTTTGNRQGGQVTHTRTYSYETRPTGGSNLHRYNPNNSDY